jgi:uncharacterized protein
LLAEKEPGMREILQESALYFTAIILEAGGFVLLGSMVGSLIEEFIPETLIPRLIGKRPVAGILIAGLVGLAFPVCECAIIPVARKLIQKGIPPAAAVAFILAVPIVNPVVAFSTYMAFYGNLGITLLRMAGGYSIAVFIAMLALKWTPKIIPAAAPGHSHHEHHNHACTHCAGIPAGKSNRLERIVAHTWEEFAEVSVFLIIGALISAVFRATVSFGYLDGLSRLPAGPTLFMMAAAFLLNLCSEADAFVASGFSSAIPAAGLLAFMVLGPMLDIKLLAMYHTIFNRKTIRVLSVLIIVCVFLYITLLDLFNVIPGVAQ